MKIVTDDAVYVQKNDIAYLNSLKMSIPSSIVNKVYKDGICIIDFYNKHDFIKFDEEDDMEYFRNLDWMIDYNEVRSLSEKEMILLARKVAKEEENLAHKFNSMSDEDKHNNLGIINECELLEFKFYSIRDLLWFKQGHITINLPDDIKVSEKVLVKNK